VVDDYVPVDKESNEPVFVSPRGNEMWTMILEKAFAKFTGSYAAIEGGYSLYAM
jgi:calpain-15